ncbi:hypothetical protein V8E52_004036 [Russula decolorans]
MIFTNRFSVLFTLAVAIAGVSAQSLDACGQTCVNSTVSKGYCSSINDTSCVCTNTQFQGALATCLTSCSSSDLTIAQEIQKETCANVSTSSTSAKASDTSSATPSASTKSNGATAVEQLPLLSAVIVIAGALMGGAFVL